ncbi:hypothetical protein AQUCO_08900013v1 [Aquilegia coerulea]|uniref:PORR domain-containing protein n=1 Tax=Aquilegia coerulea TaxID=218851 RepID=A0A2G5C652_AQUCA|nr:hypothetical protein AQUCO_08900013v1 [Aquilegia coerulea]
MKLVESCLLVHQQKPTISEVFASTPIQFQNNFIFSTIVIQIRTKTTKGSRPKKKMYHRVDELDKVMDFQKKPSLILQLKSIILNQKTQSILIRDLEKEVGFVKKWDFMAVIEKYPSIFYVSGGNQTPILVKLTEKAAKIVAEEGDVRQVMEPILVNKLRKLLMMSMDCRVPLEKIEFIQSELGLPRDFKECLIPKYPEFFTVIDVNGFPYLNLESWDSSLALTAREEKLAAVLSIRDEGDLTSFGGDQKKVKISKNGNFPGPFAFEMNFPVSFRPNMKYLEEVQKWQKMPFPSPYLSARRFEPADPKARKRAVAVLHEVLSLTMEKRLNSAQLDAFHAEYQLPVKLLLCLVKHHGIFYITNKGAKSTVLLKDAYNGVNLIEKCPLLRFNDKFVGLGCRRDANAGNKVPLS